LGRAEVADNWQSCCQRRPYLVLRVPEKGSGLQIWQSLEGSPSLGRLRRRCLAGQPHDPRRHSRSRRRGSALVSQRAQPGGSSSGDGANANAIAENQPAARIGCRHSPADSIAGGQPRAFTRSGIADTCPAAPASASPTATTTEHVRGARESLGLQLLRGQSDLQSAGQLL
jgi:hypothetical protein